MKVTRRDLLRAGGLGAAAAVSGGVLSRVVGAERLAQTSEHPEHGAGHGPTGMVGTVDHKRNGFDPTDILTDFDMGEVSRRGDQTVRTYEVFAVDKEVEIAPGLFFPAWTYNGRIPGPTLRATEGDRLRIVFRNGGSHPHTIHFHGLHPARMDGVPNIGRGDVMPGETFTYEFDAFPFGCHLYHCHSHPLKRHIHKGLYGGFIIDPDPKRHADDSETATKRTLQGSKDEGIRELLMVMNAFDTDFDGENEVYSVNTVAFAYADAPIRISTDETVRVYLINLTEFDPINSFHLHGNFFDYYDTGTSLRPTVFTDTIMQCQAQRGILEFNFKDYEPGQHMFHAHQSEFVELGWMGLFDVVEGRSA